jgi:hypothetical protein
MIDSVFSVTFYAVSWLYKGAPAPSQRHYRRARGTTGYQPMTLCSLKVPSEKEAEITDGLPATGMCRDCVKIMRAEQGL